MTVHRNVVRQNILATTTTNHCQLAKLVVERCVIMDLDIIKFHFRLGLDINSCLSQVPLH